MPPELGRFLIMQMLNSGLRALVKKLKEEMFLLGSSKL